VSRSSGTIKPNDSIGTLYDAVKRAIDVLLALSLLAFLSPLMAVIALVLCVRNRGRVLERLPRVARDCQVFSKYAFNMGDGRWRHLPALFNILKGDMSFIGPRAAKPGELCAECVLMLRDAQAAFGPRELTLREEAARRRNKVRPGLICDWWILERANMAYGHEVLADSHYIETCGFRRDAAIFLRALPSIAAHVLFGPDLKEDAVVSDVLNILDLRINNMTMRDAIEHIMTLLDRSEPRQICFVNPQCANVAYTHSKYKAVLHRSHLVFADGIGMKIAGRILGRRVRQNVNGTDLFPRLCDELKDTGKRLYLLGARPGVAEEVREWISRNYAGTQVAGCRDGYFKSDEEEQVIRSIAESRADVLLVAMGVPSQDLWIDRNLERLGVKVAMGVGGLFDFYSGRIPRAPLWVREIGMEWFYRFCQEPARMWKRYFVGNALFLLRVYRERLTGRAVPRHAQ
jgi:N-acetylglucosaminyldiphosphoundecaprenol N-acetyl-beta-D-mannosaminyltransferase